MHSSNTNVFTVTQDNVAIERCTFRALRSRVCDREIGTPQPCVDHSIDDEGANRKKCHGK